MGKKNKKKEKSPKEKRVNRTGEDKSLRDNKFVFGLDLNYSNDVPLSPDDLND